jgi:valyl-tRNA synthetase
MTWPKRYDPRTEEPRIQAFWEQDGVYAFDPEDQGPVYAIDTPPPTVSGYLHLGHTYSYSHTDFVARFWRMNGHNVFYPMGYDDNGLPTDRLVERSLDISADQVGRRAFEEKCLALSEEMERQYGALWRRLGLSIDWRYTYRTIGEPARRTAQWSFLDLYRQGLAYRQQAPSIWCPQCGTAIAQADLADMDRSSTFYTLAFSLEDGETLPIATTRPELLPACVAIFVHPEDERFRGLVGRRATVPIFGQTVPVIADPEADPTKGTGVVMCCTFGDAVDVQWWHTHDLPLVEVIAPDGSLGEQAGILAGLSIPEARERVVAALEEQGLLLDRYPVAQSVRAHDRCDTPVEYIVTQQWFIRLLDAKEAFIEAGEQITWHPAHMKARYRQWVENLKWDWCITRQRAYGVPFPVWYCDGCGEVILAPEDDLPVDPTREQPAAPCSCGHTSFTPEQDVMDTWATSSLTPQIVGQWLSDQGLYDRVSPFSLRPQAHEIIRTWAFYTIVKSHYHFRALPWKEVAISGWGLAPEGEGKISKSTGGGPIPPLEMIERYSADAVRYWAASTGLGKDTIISEEKIQLGARLVTKLWNVARFSQRFLAGYSPPATPPSLSPADRWILARAQQLVRRATAHFSRSDYAAAKHETEIFFWNDLADNYLEMAKLRLYGEAGHGARYTLYQVLLTTVKLFAPFMPHVTEEIYQRLFAATEGAGSIHQSPWPATAEGPEDSAAEEMGDILVGIATAVRRYKSENNLPLGTELTRLQLVTGRPALAELLRQAEADISSITRARKIEIEEQADPGLEIIGSDGPVTLALAPL